MSDLVLYVFLTSRVVISLVCHFLLVYCSRTVLKVRMFRNALSAVWSDAPPFSLTSHGRLSTPEV